MKPTFSRLPVVSIVGTAVLFVSVTVYAMSLIDPTTFPLTTDLAKRLNGHVAYLASPALAGRKPGTPGHREAAAYISSRFSEMGLTPLSSLGGYGQVVAAHLGENLIGLRPALTPTTAAPWILIGAHYDHLGGNFLGADDNASAVAILLETARALPRLPHHHLLFVSFTTEEPPYIRTPLMGSQHFVDHLPPELGSTSNIHIAVIMDLMGGAHWAATQNVIFAAGAEKSPDLYRYLKTPFAGSTSPLTVLPLGLHLVEEIPLVGQVAFSDYDAFRNRDVPFLFLSSGRTPRYHQRTDLPDTLHYERMASTVHWLVGLIQRADKDQSRYPFERDRLEFQDEVQALAPLIRQAADPDTMIPNSSSLALWKMRADRDWLNTLDPLSPTHQDIKRLERSSIRMQCLLANFSGCFLL